MGIRHLQVMVLRNLLGVPDPRCHHVRWKPFGKLALSRRAGHIMHVSGGAELGYRQSGRTI